MDTATPPAKPVQPQPSLRDYGMRVTAYERVASMLLAIVSLLTFVVVILLVVWFTAKILGSQAAVPVTLEEIGTGEGSLGDSAEFDTPSGEETEFQEPEVQETLAAVADAVAVRAAVLDSPALTDQFSSGSGRGGGGRTPGRGGRPGRPRNWEIHFDAGNTLEAYARQLDFFGIELGILLPGDKLEYIYRLSQPKPDRRTGAVEDEKRYYLTWRRSDLEQADRELFQRAGLNVEGRVVLKFLPAKTEQALLALETKAAGTHINDLRRTRFGIRSDRGGYTFFVIEQTIGYLQKRL
ncbi:MAG: hypothetical protein HUU20_02525 [Pirellulales bacterium]|nr:hypothetical protein [Pirellulales bacterium]